MPKIINAETPIRPMLVSLTYTSYTVHPVTQDEIRHILDASRDYNARCSITGLLCHGRGFWMQAIEGERDAVNVLYARLQRDGRHERLMLLRYQQIEARVFSDWSMGFLSASDRGMRACVYPVTGSNDLAPHTLDADQAWVIMRAMKTMLHPQVVVHPHGEDGVR